MNIGAILLGLINIGLVVAVLILIGLFAKWILSWLGFAIPAPIEKVFLVIVALIALYMIVALLLGIPTVRLIAGFRGDAIAGAGA